jgi:hypothetical protein
MKRLCPLIGAETLLCELFCETKSGVGDIHDAESMKNISYSLNNRNSGCLREAE